MISKSSLFMAAAAMGLLGLIGCPSATSGNGGRTSHTYADAVTELTSCAAGLSAAAATQDPSASAYCIPSASPLGYVCYLNDYVSNGITINGSLRVSQASILLFRSGTLNCRGGSVSQIIYDTLGAAGSNSGTYTITFNDGSSWVYDLDRKTFTAA